MKSIRTTGLFISLLVTVNILANTTSINEEERLAFETSLIDRTERESPSATRWSIKQRLSHHGVAGASVAIIKDYQVVWSSGYGVKQAGQSDTIDTDTVFSVGSVSKVANAALILRLVADGKVDLDTDVNTYLKSWKVENSRYSREKKVTLRMILAHTAGFSQHGFADFYPGEKLPTALQTLNGEYPAKHGPVELMFTPGTEMDYSGGGTTVSQVLVEDVTGMNYEDAARKYVFKPLGMNRSTFVNPVPESHGNIAKAHDGNGRPTALPRGYEAMPEMAASGLWTTANDLAKLVIAFQKSTMTDTGFIPRTLARDMMTRVNNSWHGLGPRINGDGKDKVFHHGGANNSYKAWIEGHLAAGSGIVVLTNGRNGHRLYSEIRKSAEDVFNWPVDVRTSFNRPD